MHQALNDYLLAELRIEDTGSLTARDRADELVQLAEVALLWAAASEEVKGVNSTNQWWI